MQTSSFDVEAFLRESWQKKPALITGFWSDWQNPLEPDELAGLACEEGVEARLVTHDQGTYAVEHGPFAETRFAAIATAPWTLLVQTVDHHVPDVSALIEPFRFIPSWRIDDVMVSYAVDQGGVGPHYDQYDVFLIQGLGKRRWQVAGRCDEGSQLIEHDDLRLLAHFEPVREWILEPGDILYVPPGYAHNGVAVSDDCMTYSIGFRAPSRGDLVEDWAQHLVDHSSDHDRYMDPALVPQDNPGEITSDALASLRNMIRESLDDEAGFARWFGRYNTAAKNAGIDWAPETCIDAASLRASIAMPLTLVRNPACRFAFIRGSDGTITLFVDGNAYDCSGMCADFAERICATNNVVVSNAMAESASAIALLGELLNLGALASPTKV